MKNISDKKNRDNNYNKIKHLVEVDDDILAVFSMDLMQVNELYIAKNSNIDRNYIDSLIHILGLNQTTENENLLRDITKEKEENKILG